VAIRTERNRTKGVKLFVQPFHGDELRIFGTIADGGALLYSVGSLRSNIRGCGRAG
jgi:hypothetical protein